MEREFNGFLPPNKEMPIPDGMRIIPGKPNDDATPYVTNYQVNPIINEGHFQMNIGGQVPSSWSINQIAHYVKFAGPSDTVFAEKAKELLRERGYDI
ncbi:hypothetical protein YYC_00892 [Plasmodium yoelii 17X]|uniref:Gamete release protein n=3 Tax=Plasmodium yoelii TaxID=5861 RepID=A0AAE9WUN6_PLAYO|nr:IMC-associated apicomplexan protein, putative [Plasmodium yoelii]ETB62285.1 hypothetical protein YYC_00892 [Plasmodium yoelii 17X]WBY59301.1 gamete release protein [Plasmodium yoelii yoelii]CDU19452.1 conserved Plasmodium protein, unknown function [Plasmodium yoelii]VTZ80087.1 IMC-associated apicomplexan protein, putative [Plasmodium yoelii]|eukprot:XP_022812663.1 IMC-associated apicomplexan protein, putative [Plasmodium yoelii]